MKTAMKVVLGLVVVIGLIVWAVFALSSGVDDAAEAVMADLNNGNYEKVYNDSLMTEAYTLEEFAQLMGIGSSLDIATAELVSWGGRGLDNGEKYISGTFKFADGSEQIITFWFLDQGGKLSLLGITGETPYSVFD